VDLVSTTTVPRAPRSLTATAANRAARLRWLAPSSNGGAAISDYRVQRSANGGRTWRRFGDGVSTARTVTVTGLANGHRYWFRVAAVNRVGRGPWSAAASAVPATVSSAPRQLSATRAYRAAKLSWLAPWSNGGAAITDYRVQRSANGGRTWRRVRDGVSTRRAATVNGLTSGQRYSFRVRAKNRAGLGAWSAIVRITPR
jgi:predicted phage tail protein